MQVIMAILTSVALLCISLYLLIDNREQENRIKELESELKAIRIMNDILKQKNAETDAKRKELVLLVDAYKNKLSKVSEMFK